MPPQLQASLAVGRPPWAVAALARLQAPAAAALCLAALLPPAAALVEQRAVQVAACLAAAAVSLVPPAHRQAVRLAAARVAAAPPAPFLELPPAAVGKVAPSLARRLVQHPSLALLVHPLVGAHLCKWRRPLMVAWMLRLQCRQQLVTSTALQQHGPRQASSVVPFQRFPRLSKSASVPRTGNVALRLASFT